jgi:hypothetical protein
MSFKKLVLSVLFAFSTACAVYSQGTINGHITEANGNPVVGVVVRITGSDNLAAISDFDGYFKLALPDNKSYELYIAYIGFEDLRDTLSLSKNEVRAKEYVLLEKSIMKDEVNVVARAVRSSDNYMERIKRNASVSIDYISSETIKKTGDANVINSIARVSGVSTNGGLITVRGIGDRYVRTTLNGSRIPTLDPMTNNIKLDIFPNSLVDNIVISKTYSPDLPGDWAGAYISVETKDFPDKLMIQLESQIGYNTQTTFKDIISSERSSTDWLGFDNGLRTREDVPIVAPNLRPSEYQEMVALGLGEYYNNMGVSGWSEGNSQGDLYFRMGLVQLGLLGDAQINDDEAVDAATSQYNSTYKPLAFNRINPNGKNYDNGFSNRWNTIMRKAPLNNSQSFSIGNNIKFFNRELGFMVGFKYASSQRYDPNGISQRVGDETLGFPFDIQEYAKISRETNSWSALMSASLKLNEFNKISFLFMPNVIGNNDVANYTSIRLPTEFQDIDVTNNIFYEQRRQLIYQLGSSHYIPGKKIKIDFNTSYTDGRSIAPDFKAIQYLYVVQGDSIVSYQFSPTAGDGIRRYYRFLDENAFDTRIAMEMPLANSTTSLTRKLKFGGGTFRNDRKIDNDEYRVMLGNNNFLDQLTNGDLDTYMSADRFTMKDGIADFKYEDFYTDRNHSFGYSNVHSVYLMTDYAINTKWRISAGVRGEYTDIFTDVDKYDQMNYERNDPRRLNVGGFPYVNAADIQQFDILPSANLIYTHITPKGIQSNLRMSFSQNLARPSIRELSDAAIFDNEFRTLIYGNSDLKTAQILNYDVRFETYFNMDDNVSISAFYKDFHNHIEMGFGSSGITWENIDQSTVRGIEIEGSKNIWKGLSIKANATFVKSEAQFVRRDFQVVEGIKIYTPIDTILRQMYGQAPYILNGILSYKSDSLGFVITASYNVQGPRLVIAGAIRGRPDVYELPRHSVDIKASKKLGEHFTASLTIRDLLNAPVRRSYDLPDGWVDYDNFRYGTNYMLSLAYKF